MGRDRHRRKRERTERFWQHMSWFDNSPAWRSLTPVERVIYWALKVRYNGSNNGRISASSRELGDYANVSKSTAARVVKTLVEKGFIKITRDSGFNVKCRIATEYLLTEFDDNRTGSRSSREFHVLEESTVPLAHMTVPFEGHQIAKRRLGRVYGTRDGTAAFLKPLTTVPPEGHFYYAM